MIRGVHTMFYTSQPEATRAFFRDTFGLPYTDVGEGWFIFDLPEADLGFHPADDRDGARNGTPAISFYCDDIEKSIADLTSRGVVFTNPVEDHGYGLVTFFKAPGDFEVQLYQPRYVKNPRPIVEATPAIETAQASTSRKPKALAAKTKTGKKPAVKTPVKKAAKRVAAKPAAKPSRKAKGRK